jgi:hypothetical protein
MSFCPSLQRWCNYRTAQVLCAFLDCLQTDAPDKLKRFQFTQWGGYESSFNARFHLVEFKQEVQRPTWYVHNGRELHKHITQHAGIGQVALHLHSVPEKARNPIEFQVEHKSPCKVASVNHARYQPEAKKNCMLQAQ